MSRTVEVIQKLPWVTELRDKTLECEGIKWSTVALKDLYSYGDRPARGIQERSRCKKRARWYFKALKNSRADSGNYCTIHVVVQISHYEEETERAERYLKKHRHLKVVS